MQSKKRESEVSTFKTAVNACAGITEDRISTCADMRYTVTQGVQYQKRGIFEGLCQFTEGEAFPEALGRLLLVETAHGPDSGRRTGCRVLKGWDTMVLAIEGRSPSLEYRK